MPVDRSDALILAGLVIFIAGVALVYVPAAVMVAGIGLAAVGVFVTPDRKGGS